MMKKVLSVALSVIMVLSLLSVPGFAADPAAVEYTVSNVSYAGEVYDELNPSAGEDGYAIVEGITSIPENGRKIVPSVKISATADTTATAIFAVYTDGVLTNAFYETKAVGTTAVEFSKDITVANNEKETYKVFALGADGKAIAPVSNFPVAVNALEYIEISYADGTVDKHYGADLEGTTIVSNISAERKVANPSIKVVPADNTTVVTIDIDADFWTNGATVELKALDGSVVTFEIISDLIKASYTPALAKIYQYEGATLTKTIKTYDKQYASFESTAEVVNVTVPYGTASLTLDPITIYENGVPKKSATEEISMDGADVKEYTIGIGSKEYKFVFKWDDSVPYINNVKFGGDYAARSAVLRADNGNAVGYTMSTDISKAHEKATVANGITAFTVNDTEIAIDENFTLLAIAREDNFARTDMVSYAHPKGISSAENEAWTTFTVSEPATVYVKMSHANAAEAGFAWKEGVAAGWTKATSSNQGTVYYKTFAAGETVNIPSQVVTEDELAFVNAKLETAYPASGAVQFKYALAEGAGAQLHYSADGKAYDDDSKTWEAHPTGKNTASDGKLQMADGKYYRGLYYRNAGKDTGLSVSYGSTFFIAVAFNAEPGEGGDPEVPPVDPDEPDEPEVPAAPTLEWESAIALTSTPKTQGQGPANRRDLHKDGLYRVGAVSGSVELNPEETTVNLTVPYGVEVVKMGDVSVNLLDDADHAATATVTVAEVEYTVNVSWAAYAYNAENADMPMLYDLEYTATGRTGLYDTNWYYAIPTNLVLDADHDYVVGEGDLKGMKADGSGLAVDMPSGTWFTKQSHDNVNLSSTNSGSQVNRLHLGPTAFESWVTAGYLETKYDLNGATSIIANYTDEAANNAVRYKFKAGVDGYVIVASRKINTALTAEDGWAQLTDATMKFTNSSTTAHGEALNRPPEGHTNVVKSYAEWSGDCNYIYAKKVSVGEDVEVAESTVASNYPPIVIVATEDMITLDIADTEDPEAPVDPQPPVDPDEPEEPTATKLASINFTTAAHLRYTEATVTETGTAAWAEDATEYVVNVPVGTGVVTVSAATDYAETPNTLAEAVTVDMAGKDTATAEILGNTVTFKWDDTDPYITDVVINAAFKGRWGVDSGADGDLTYQATSTNESGALSNIAFSKLANTGETAPEVTKYVYSIATHTMNGQAHMANVTFGMRDVAYEGTNAENSLLSFKVSADATVYVKAVALDGQWEELAEAGWTEAGTLSGAKVYKKDFAAGSYVYLPGTPTDDEEAEGYNANPADANIRYVKYVPSATVETTADTMTLAEAYDGYDTSVLFEGKWYQWSYDATEGKLVEPKADGNKKPFTIDRSMNNGKYVPAFYVQFAAPAVPEEVTLASYTVSTEKLAMQQDVAAVTDQAGTFEGEEYTIVVPVGTATATATVTASNEATAEVSVTFDGTDAESTIVTIGEDTFIVNFKWDDTNPYIYGISMKDNDFGNPRVNVQYGNLAAELKVGGNTGNVPHGNVVTDPEKFTYVGVPTPDATADTVVVGIAGAVSGTIHMAPTDFKFITTAYPATEESNAFMSFKVNGEGTIYVVNPSAFNYWPEMDALVAADTGWYLVTYENEGTHNATISDKQVYAIDVESGDTVLIPSLQITDAYMAEYNAYLAETNATSRYIKYDADAMVDTVTGEISQANAMAAKEIGAALVEGKWFAWSWDAEAGKYKAPIPYTSKTPYRTRMPIHDQLMVYGFFGDYAYVPPVVEDPEPEVPPVDPNPGEPDNSANELVLSYTTALAVTSPKSTANHINGKNRVDGKTSIYAGGLYMPTLVETAANAVVDHEAKTAVVTVPFGTEIVNLVAATGAEVAIDLADNASIVMLNDNGAEKTFNVVAGENTYAVTVKWADASDANIGAASTGADVYGLQFAKADLWTAGQNATYGIVPTKIDLSYEVSVDASKYEEGKAPTSLRNGVYYAGGNTTLFAGNMTAKNDKTGSYADLARYKLFTGSFTPWVEAGIIASEADLDNATIVNTGEHYKDAEYDTTSSNAPADGARYAFNVEAAGVVYVASAKTFTNDGTWTRVDAETWIVTRGGSSKTGYIYSIGNLGSALYVKNVAAGEKVTITCAGKDDQPPVVIYDAGAVFAPADPTFASASYKIGDADAAAIDFAEGTTAAVEVPWGTDADISVTAKINGIGSVAVSDAINLATAVDNTADVTITVKAFDGEVVATYTVTFAWGEKPADPEEPGEGEEPTPEEPTLTFFGDIEDGGILAETVEAPDAAQDAASTDVTVEGNKGEEARGEHVLVYVLAEGKTFADIQAALALGSGDLVADGIVLGMGSATVDENGGYAVDMTLPNDVTSGSYDIVIDDETHEDALDYTAISEKVAVYNAIVTGAADPFADVDLIISTNDIYTALTPAGKAAVEASVLAKDAVAALPVITEPNPGEYVGLENIATLATIIDTRIAVEALNDGADAEELALVWNYILPAADAQSDDIVAVAVAIYEDALNAAGIANVVDAITEQGYETETVEGVQVPVKTQVQNDFAEAAFVELINNTTYTNINAVAALVNKYIAADVFEDLTSVSTTTLSKIVRDYTITSYADFEEKVADIKGGSDTPVQGGTEVVPSTPSTGGGTTSGSMSNTTTGVKDPVTEEKPYKALSEFKDAADAAWAAPALQMMLDRNILNGYEDDTIRPNNTASRQEVAKMLVQALSKVNTAAWVGFDDVQQGEWYYAYVATATKEGIIKGIGDNKFGTNALITREDLSVLIYRYLVSKGNVLDTNANKNFTDAAKISDYAVDAVNALTNAGVINGYTNGSFNPKGNATRAEIAQVIANVITIYNL